MKHLLLIILTFAGISLQAQKRPETYNYQRGLEAMQNEKWEEAEDFFYKDVKENEQNGYSYSWLAYIHRINEEYGKALGAANLAIKYLPKKDMEYVVFAYATRGDVYLILEDTLKALQDFSTAIKLKPDDHELYEKRANIYYLQKNYTLSDMDYKKETELNAGSPMGYMGLGRNASALEKWEESIKYYDYVTKLASDYSPGYSFRAKSYIELEKWNEATDDLVTAMGLDWDRMALFLMSSLKDPALTMLISKLKVQASKAPNEAKWPYVIGSLYEQNENYQKAIKAYSDANSIDPAALAYYRIAICCSKTGDFTGALKNIDKALEMDSTDVQYMGYKANIYYEMGNPERAISEWDKALTAKPDYAWGYYRRGWFKSLLKQNDDAIEDLSMAIVLDPDYAYSYASRGDLYLKMGKRELAEADFHKIIEIEDTPEEYECLQYAYQGLGQYDKAKEVMQAIIDRDVNDAGSYYDAACVYCKMGYKDEALTFLEKSLELGYKRFSHIERDDDLDLIRNTEEFKRLIKKYNTAPVSTSQTEMNQGKEKVNEIISRVPFTKENGVYKVQCKINGLPLHFVFDTGASDVTLSLVEANFMMKNGYLSASDVVGSQRFMDANGDVSVGTVINIREVSFGDLNLNNVRASVVRNQRAPLLLGQSVLSRLGKIEIDNPGRVLKITHQKY